MRVRQRDGPRRGEENGYARMEITNGERKTNGANGEKQLLELAERHARNGAGQHAKQQNGLDPRAEFAFRA